MNKGLIGAAKLTLIFIVLLISIFSIYNFTPTLAETSTTIWTTDIYGNPKADFAPEQIVYIHGSYFLTNHNVDISVTRPNGVIDNGSVITDSSGNFVYNYQLDGIEGDYVVIATDKTNTALTTFKDAAAFHITVLQPTNNSVVIGSVRIRGRWNVTNGPPGQLSQYNVQIQWGDGNITNAVNINRTDNGLSGQNQIYSGTFDTQMITGCNATDGVDNCILGNFNHTYNASISCGPFNITVKLYHAQPPGNEAGDASSTIKVSPGEVCNNGIDDDCDGLIDCADPDCSSYPSCVLCSSYADKLNCAANSNCKWCPLCEYIVRPTKVNQWLQEKCVPKTTDCGWHCEIGQCGATCDADSQCTCHADYCNGTTYVDYPDYGHCVDCPTSCYCQNGTNVGEPCHPTLYTNDSRCGECKSDNDCNRLDKDYCDGTMIKHDEGKCIGYFCNLETTTVQDCNLQDGWYNTTNIRWVDIDQCNEKEEIQQEYRDYTCSAASCIYSVTNNQWVDTGRVRNKPDNTVCGDTPFGECDVQDTCSSGVCTDNVMVIGTECRASEGACDLAEVCDGASHFCPADEYLPNTVECRASAGVCDVADFCSGSSASCPTDIKSTSLCRTSAGICDVPESCDGINNNCPSDSFLPDTTLCRALAGVCDVEEMCTGSDASCPTDTFASAGTPCYDELYCNGQETCDDSGHCQNGIPVDCRGNDTSGIETCDNNPDNIHFTWDFRNPFKSVCDETNDACTTGDDTITHTCSVNNCGAECDSTHSCDSKCIGDTRYFSGSCNSTCNCDYSTEDCSLKNGWYNTTNTQWVSVSRCKEKEQLQQEYRDYTCSDSTCDYSITDNQWIDTGETRDKSIIPPLNPPNKTIGEPKSECQQDEWCEWKITTLTPITLTCENSSVKWRYALDGDWKEWHFDDSPVTIYFPEESNHTLEAYCIDDCGNSTADVEKFKVEGTAFEIPLNKKWNLISVPFTLFNDNPEEVFKDAKDEIVSVWTYDNGQWYMWDPLSGGTLTSIKPGWGYWVITNNDTKLLIAGSLFSPIATPPSKSLQNGWNLIGYYGTDWQTYQIESDNCGYDAYKYGNYVYCSLNSLVDTQEGFPRWSSLWGYDNCGNDNATWHQLESCVGDFWSINKMFAGKGYWIEMDVKDNYAPASNCMWNKEFKCSVPIL